MQELPPERVCDEVGYSIANRTETCTGDSALAVDRYHAYLDEFQCRAGPNTEEPVASFYHCPVTIRTIPCEQWIAWGSDIERVLLVDPVCAEFLTHKDGRPLFDRSDAGADDSATAEGG
jgi:hypothetical protein